MIGRRKPPAHEPCACQQLAERLAEAEADHAAIVRMVVTLRPIARHHSLEQGLVAWGAKPEDARRMADILRRQPT